MELPNVGDDVPTTHECGEDVGGGPNMPPSLLKVKHGSTNNKNVVAKVNTHVRFILHLSPQEGSKTVYTDDWEDKAPSSPFAVGNENSRHSSRNNY